MKILLFLILAVLGIIVLLLVLALFIKKQHFVKRDIIINAPVSKVYDFLKHLKNQDKFNKWAKDDPSRNWQYKGEDGNIGFVISWNGNKNVGEGEKEIIDLIENKKVATQIRFIRPMRMTADIIFETESTDNGQTNLSMINTGTMKYPMNIFVPMAEKNFPKDMDESLSSLKKLLEDQ